MRFVRFSVGDNPQYGVVEGDPGAEVISLIGGDPLYTTVQFTGMRVPLAEVRVLAPVLPRSKVLAVGRNYAEHAAEMGEEVPAEPLVFLKPNTSVIGPGEPIRLPPQSSEVHFEGELAVIIKRLCKDVPVERADEVILGYTIANDVTARDLQKKDGQWSRAKGFDSFCPLGPWIETDLDPQRFADGVRVQTHLNGDLVQDGSTKDLIFDIPTLVAHITSVMTLLPGDVILTGTPDGIGPMQPGDEVEVSIEGLGTLTNTVVRR